MLFSDPSQNDLTWRGYSGWAMLPSFAVCFALSLVLLTGSWFFEEFRNIGQEIGSMVFFLATLAIWLGQLLRWLYRGATYVYRLTPAYLYLDRGFLYNRELPVDLAKVIRVAWGSNAVCRFFGVGWVLLTVEGRESLQLTGILRPAGFAEEIEALMKERRGQVAENFSIADKELRVVELLALWRSETAQSSSSTVRLNHPAYQELIAMGKTALPTLLRDLEQTRDGYLSQALSAITGRSPAAPIARGDIALAADDWLRWAKEKGL